MAAVRQVHFGGGELSPLLWGRTDLPLFARGLRRLRNFFITPHGMAMSRGGTRYLGRSKYAAGAGGSLRFIPFIYSDALSYVLEVGDQYLRVWQNGAYTGTELTTPYYGAEVKDLQWTQVGAVMTLTHPNYGPRELKVSSAGGWSLGFCAFFPHNADGTTLTASGFHYDQVTGAMTYYPMLVNNPPGTLFFFDTAHPPREWRWKRTCTVREDATGLTFETAPEDITKHYDGSLLSSELAMPADNAVVLYPDRAVVIRVPDAGGGVAGSHLSGFTTIASNYYRGRGSLFGYVGSTTTRDFCDNGAEPDYLTQPPASTNPFTGQASSVTDSMPNKPQQVGVFEGRRVFAVGSRLLFSAADNFSDHDPHTLPVPGQALDFEVVLPKPTDVRFLVPAKRLLVFTAAGVISIGGAADDMLDFDSVQRRTEDAVGCATLPPLAIDGAYIWARSKGVGVRGLAVSGSGELEGLDLSYHADHLFSGQTEKTLVGGFSSTLSWKLVDWCFARDPWRTVWAAREDGGLLSFTYAPETGVVAWALHDSAGGSVKALCSIPEGTEDVVYLAVDRGLPDGTLAIERMASRIRLGSGEDDQCLDSCIRSQQLDGVSVGGLSHLEGRQVWACAVANPPAGPFTVVGGTVTWPAGTFAIPNVSGSDQTVIFVGLLYTPEVETLDVAATEARLKQKTVVSVGFEVDQARGLSIGQDFDHLVEWRQRQVSDSYGAVGAATDLVVVPVKGKWDRHARAALRQTLPLPVTLVGITREVDVGN